MILTWWTNWIDAMGMEIPDKFHIAGFGNGAYQVGLYASRNPQRINKLLLLSPASFYPKDYDITCGIHPYASYKTKPKDDIIAEFKA